MRMNALTVLLCLPMLFGHAQRSPAQATRPLNPEGISQLPRWSPDGSQIAFESDRDGNYEIYVVDSDGRNLRRLTKNNYSDLSPSWSPDGSKIVYSSEATGETFAMPSQSAIFIMSADGTDVRRLTNTRVGGDRPVPYFNDTYPVWEPNGERIAFLSDRAGGFREIFVVRPDGSELTQVTFRRAHHWNLAWTPDGNHIVFDGRLDGFLTAGNPVWGMHTVRVSGPIYSWGDPIRVLRNDLEAALEYDSAISWDGKSIIFNVAHRDRSQQGLYFAVLGEVAGAPSVVEETIEIRAGDYYSVDWSPDGQRIAFTSNRDGHPEIYVMDADGTNVTRLTHSR